MRLLTSTRLGKLQPRNRIVMAPMTRSRADMVGVVGELTVRYYVQRATAGLIITEATNVSADAVGSPLTPGIWNEAQVAAWRRVTSAVHAEGGTIVMQLWHTGRVGHSEVRGGHLPVAPSAVAIQGQKHFTASGPKDYETPRALTTEEVRATIDDFERGARNARAAGFDGVELHGAFGYLPHQFLVDSANHRTDEYGGSVENRARFVLEVMERLVRVWGDGRVGIRLSPTLAYNGMVDSDPRATFSYLIERLNALPLAYLHLMRATPDADRFPHWPKDAVATFGPLFRGPIIVNGGYDRDSAEAVLADGAAHAVSFGAPFVSNPDLVHRFEVDAPLAAGDRSTFYGGGAKGYVDYPALRSESVPAVKGYWLVQASVTNPAQFGNYTALAGPTLASYGGRVLARGDVAEVVEGSLPRRPYFVEFPSYAAARACFHSAAYQEAITLRAGAAEFDIVIVEGMPSGHQPAGHAEHETFVILAETLAGWRSPATPEGREVLERHYQWAARHQASGALLFAGPVDVASMGPGAPTPVGRVTGFLVFRAATRSDAEAIAHEDPFHVAGFRENHVHAWSIRFAQTELGAAIAASLARSS